MDILKKKNINSQLYNFIELLKFKNYKIDLLGSSSYESVKYFSDYDLYSKIHDNFNNDEIIKEYKNIFDKIIKNINMFFIEAKIQNKKQNKKKYYSIDSFLDSDLYFNSNDIDFIKFDFVIYINDSLKELSIIYNFNTDNNDDNSNLLNKLIDDVNEYYKEKKYFKALKRIFSYIKSESEDIKNKEYLVELTNFFNSNIGKIYNDLSILESIICK